MSEKLSSLLFKLRANLGHSGKSLTVMPPFYCYMFFYPNIVMFWLLLNILQGCQRKIETYHQFVVYFCNRAIKGGSKSPVLVVPSPCSLEHAWEATVLGALHALYVVSFMIS